MERNNRQDALKSLLEIAATKGYVTFDTIMGCADDYGLSLPDFDWLSNEAASRNVIIYDEEPATREIDEDEAVDDYAQVDYEAVYSEIKSLCPAMESFVERIRNIRPPQFKETAQLKHLVREGNAHARERMIEMHLRLALRIGFQRAKAYDADIEDTVGDACIGLINAVDRYDPNTSGPFSSYASLWILQNVTREQPTQNPLMYFPVHRREDYYTLFPILKAAGFLEGEDLEDNPKAIEMICQKLDCKPDQLTDIWNAIIPFRSLNQILSDPEEDEYRIHLAFDVDPLTFEEEMVDNIDSEIISTRVHSILSTLTPREEMVIKLRYGIEDGRERTLEEVGKVLKVTRERIRQIEVKALRKLKHPSRQKILNGLVEKNKKTDDQNNKTKKKEKQAADSKLSEVPETPQKNRQIQESPDAQKHDLLEIVHEWEEQKPPKLTQKPIAQTKTSDIVRGGGYSADPLINSIVREGLSFRDKRNKGGCLWIFGGLRLVDSIRKLENEFRIEFFLKADGPSGENQPAWWTKGVKRN